MPLWTFGNAFANGAATDLKQRELCGTLATLLGLEHSKASNPSLLASHAATRGLK